MPNTPDETANAVDREAAWLQQSDSIASLLTANGGPWDVVQAYWVGSRFHQQRTGIYVTRRALDDNHPLAQRYRPMYQFVLMLVWPVKNPNPPIAETEQRNFDAAIGQLLKRIRDVQGDKTHGGRFLSVAEVPEGQPVSVVWEDPEITLDSQKALRAVVTYHADDIEFNG